MCNFHVCKWKNAYIKDLNALRMFIIFYVFIKVKEGAGCTNAFICMGTHSQPLLQNGSKDVYETW